MLEVQIAFAVLGMGLAGLCPFVVMQLRQLVKLEKRFQADSYTYNSIGMAKTTPGSQGQVYYVVPWNNPWARKLSTRGQLLTTKSNASDPADLSVPQKTDIHVKLKQPVSSTLDANGNVSELTAVVEYN